MNLRFNRALVLSAALALLIPLTGRAAGPERTYNKSWIWVDASNGGKPLTSGDGWDVPVEYYVDQADHDGKTTLALWGTGPFIDTPDGKYVKQRGHISLPGLFSSFDIMQPGKGRHVFHFTVPPDLDLVRKDNRILLIASFRDSTGKQWPWEHRVNTSFRRKRGWFEIESAAPGNLFTYSEPVRLEIRLKEAARQGESRSLHYMVHDTSGATVAQGDQSFAVTGSGQRVPLNLNIKERGVFHLEVDVPGWETRRTTFARIPDLNAAAKSGSTPFGMTVEDESPPEETWAIAHRLGLTTCRRFVSWYRLEPGPGVYKLDELERELDTARRHGMREWLCIGEPPPFAFTGPAYSVSYNAFDFRDDVWRDFVRTVSTRLKGKFIGWEWLNEITPGRNEDPVKTYARMCRIGAETAKAVDPSLLSIMAGGLWPRAFRSAVLAEGVGRYIDVLPVHYQNGGGVREAREDLDAVGRQKVAVWDDESARGRNAWGVPPIEEMRNTEQAEWVLRQWPDELSAGCSRITYFGGRGDAAGSWEYALDDMTPRPVAATIAVLTSKLSGSKPLGTFQEGSGGQFHLFERDGKPVLVASVDPKTGIEAVRLNLGSASVTLTDYQGNETVLDTHAGIADLPRAPLPYFVEGGDPDRLKALVVPDIAAASSGSGAGAGNMRAAPIVPSGVMVQGSTGRLAVRLRNPYGRRITGTVKFEMPAGWQAATAVPFDLAPGQQVTEEIRAAVPAGALASDYPASVEVAFKDRRLPNVKRPLVLSVISRDMLGNLMPNGGFEIANVQGSGPEGFSISGRSGKWASAEGLLDGLGSRVVQFGGTTGWESCARTIPVRGGQTYLYTFWARNRNMDAGSNLTIHLANGRDVQLYDMEVIYCGQNNPYWQMFTCKKQMPPGAQSASFLPLANGKGDASFDNIRVTLYQGSDYAAEAHRAKVPPKLGDGLGGWTKTCPVPLIGRNQLTFQAPGYAWTPDNLSGVAYVNWDASNLYIAVAARDNAHNAVSTSNPSGDEIINGDSLILAVDPTMRSPSAASRSFAYYLSSASPGTGSGRQTLFRPPAHSGGRPAGHLFRDSSIYDMKVIPSAGSCLYLLRIPFSELGIQPTVGTRIGLSLQLNDNDGTGLAARMNWGGGLSPVWNPREFGIVTLVE